MSRSLATWALLIPSFKTRLMARVLNSGVNSRGLVRMGDSYLANLNFEPTKVSTFQCLTGKLEPKVLSWWRGVVLSGFPIMARWSGGVRFWVYRALRLEPESHLVLHSIGQYLVS
jgi:hypothetical protein